MKEDKMDGACSAYGGEEMDKEAWRAWKEELIRKKIDPREHRIGECGVDSSDLR
jgi:hypothetical protein